VWSLLEEYPKWNKTELWLLAAVSESQLFHNRLKQTSSRVLKQLGVLDYMNGLYTGKNDMQFK